MGLGNIGLLASKPVMEKKALLFKTFDEIKLVWTGGASAGIPGLSLLLSLGVKRENLGVQRENMWRVDHLGVIYKALMKR